MVDKKSILVVGDASSLSDVVGDAVVVSSLSQAIDEFDSKFHSAVVFSPQALESGILADVAVAFKKPAGQTHNAYTDLLDNVTANTKANLACLDREFNFLWVNEAYAENAGYTPGQLLGRNHFDLFPHPVNQRLFEEARDTGKPCEAKHQPFVYAKHPEWGTTYWNWTLTPIKGVDVTVESLVLSLVDMTEDVRTKQETESLRHEAERHASELQAIVEGIGDGLVITDKTGKILAANDAACKGLDHALVGYTFEELAPVFDVRTVDGKPLDVGDEEWVTIISTDTTAEFEILCRTPSRKDIVLYGRSAPIKSAGGEVSSKIHVFRDISARMRERRQLQESNRKIVNILESLADGFIAYDKNWRFTYLNAAAEGLLRRSRQELLGKVLWDEFPLAIGRPTETHYLRAMEEQSPQVFETEYRQFNIWVEARAYPSPDGLSVYLRDITRRKRTEQRLSRLHECLLSFGSDPDTNIASLVELAGELLSADHALFCRLDGDAAILAAGWNIPTEKVSPFPAKDLISRFTGNEAVWFSDLRKNNDLRIRELISECDTDTCIARAIKQGEEITGFVMTLHHNDPSTREDDCDLLEIIASALTVEEQRRKAVNDLIATRNSLEHLLSTTPAVIYSCRKTDMWRAVFVSENLKAQLGYEPSDFLNDPWFWSSIVHPGDAHRVSQTLNEFIEKGGISIEYRVRHKDGGYRWIHDIARISVQEDGHMETIGCWTDITERRQATERLAHAQIESERRTAELESLISSIPDGVSLIDRHGNVVWMNEAGKRILGVQPDDPMQDWAHRFQRFSLDGVPLPAEDIPVLRALDGEITRDARYKIVSPSGKQTAISISVSPIADADGRVVGVTDVFRDIGEELAFERHRQEMYDREHHIADTLQRALIPDVNTEVPGYAIGCGYLPAAKEAQVGGDFYDTFRIPDGRVALVMGDVSGKGLQAAVHTAMAKYMLRAYACDNPQPSLVMEKLNTALADCTPEDLFVTIFYGILDPSTGTLEYANAGHDLPIIYRSETRCTSPLEVTGPAAGIVPRHAYSKRSLEFSAGDVLVIYTDGITDARSGKIEFGIDGVSEVIRRTASDNEDALVETIFKAASEAADGRLHDDAAVLVIKASGDKRLT